MTQIYHFKIVHESNTRIIRIKVEPGFTTIQSFTIPDDPEVHHLHIDVVRLRSDWMGALVSHYNAALVPAQPEKEDKTDERIRPL